MAKQLQRTVGLGGALLLGLGSILGTGVFVALGLAAGVSGWLVIPAIAGAALLATCNGLSSAQLAAAHPVAGGTYAYGYRYLTPLAGFSAGWLFLLAKSASAAAAALALAGYLDALLGLELGRWPRTGLALGIIALVLVAVLGGLRRSNRLNLGLVVLVLGGLVCFVVAAFSGISDWATIETPVAEPLPWWQALGAATATIFVAFTGYGRVATLGEEIQDPVRNIPRAVVLTLGVSTLTYLAVAIAALALAGAAAYGAAAAGQAAPLAALLEESGIQWAVPLVVVAAGAALAGVLLNLILGLSRTALAMGRQGDLPAPVATLNASGTTPVVAVWLVTLFIAGLACIGDIALIWQGSAATVLAYYALANASALAQPPSERRYPRAVSLLGLLLCVGSLPFVDPRGLVAGAIALALGMVWFAIRASARQRLRDHQP